MFRNSKLLFKSISLCSLTVSYYYSYNSYCSSSNSSSSNSSLLRGYCELLPRGKPCHNNNNKEGEKEDNNIIKGYVRFEDDGKTCRIFYRVTGLKPGLHGFHM